MVLPPRLPPFSLVTLLLLVLSQWIMVCHGMSTPQRLAHLAEVRSMIHHAYDSYMTYAYPLDELNPITCQGRGSDKGNRGNININDVLGDFSLTLIDSLDTLAVIGNTTEFHRAVKLVIKNVSFNLDSLVSVFEVTIRVLGALLSAHLFVTQPQLGDFRLHGYNDELLTLALDLGNRLLPAFEGTATGIPFPRVVLNEGVPFYVINETCTAGAGTLLLEFGLLSRLSGDHRFERAARRAVRGLWDRRSPKSLLGNVINIQTGHWVHQESGVGAGIDSFYEYLLKAHVLFQDDELLAMFSEAYDAILAHVRDPATGILRNVHMSSGQAFSTWVDSLSAYFPGLQVLHGDVEGAVLQHEVYYSIWRRYGMLPERYDFHRKDVNIPLYPLRPELIESTYHLYQATKDPYYLEVGARLLRDLQTHTRRHCGFATVHNVLHRTHDDRMESFFLAETLKYLYLLFDTDHALHQGDLHFVFSTEGHIMYLPGDLPRPPRPAKGFRRQSQSQGVKSPTCKLPTFTPRSLTGSSEAFRKISVELGIETQHPPTPEQPPSSPPDHGICLPDEAPKPMTYTARLEGAAAGNQKLPLTVSGTQIYASSLAGYTIDLQAFGNDVFRITKLDDILVAPGVRVNVLQSGFFQQQDAQLGEFATLRLLGAATTTEFVARPSLYQGKSTVTVAGVRGQLHPLVTLACSPLTTDEAARVSGRIVLVDRGDCLFDTKIGHAREAGALAVVIVNTEEGAFEMTVGPEVREKATGTTALPSTREDTLPAGMVTAITGAVLRDLAARSAVSVELSVGYAGDRTSSLQDDLLMNFNGKPVDNAHILKAFPGDLPKPPCP